MVNFILRNMEKIKLAIVGSRTFDDQSLFDKIMSKLEEKYEIEMVISGGAKGADSFGENWADNHNIEKKIFYPDWEKYGKRAGFLRNIDIIKNCDVCVAFWDRKSHGTKHDIDLCDEFGKVCYIVNFIDKTMTIWE